MTQTPEPTSPSAPIYLSAIFALAALALPAFAEQAPEPLSVLLLGFAAVSSGLGTLMATLAACARWLGIDQPCPWPRCRRSPATLDCVRGEHED